MRTMSLEQLRVLSNHRPYRFLLSSISFTAFVVAWTVVIAVPRTPAAPTHVSIVAELPLRNLLDLYINFSRACDLLI